MHNLNPVLKSVEIVENKSYLNKNSKLYFCQTCLLLGKFQIHIDYF